jgi:hypothetical protein
MIEVLDGVAPFGAHSGTVLDGSGVAAISGGMGVRPA